jgi:hydroxyisourate hydrolase
VTTITTHVLDTVAGLPSTGVPVTLEALLPDHRWAVIEASITDDDGRIRSFPAVGDGRHRLVFAVDTPFFPEVVVTFEVSGQDHLHVPLLISPYGYSTYRGS